MANTKPNPFVDGLKKYRFYKKGRKTYQVLRESYNRRFPPAHRGIERHGLKETQIYPAGVHFDEELESYIMERFNEIRFDVKTPVASVGSCFAEHFAEHMISNGFNYIRAEENVWNASANWGRVYTIPNLGQIVDYSTDPDYPIHAEFTDHRSWKDKTAGWFDPLRDRSPTGQDREQAEYEIRSHRKASLQVLKNARILVITLGQNEAWFDKINQIAWANRPPDDILNQNPYRFEFRTFSHEEDRQRFKQCLLKVVELNPDVQLILTISPVPSYATFHDKSVITQSFYNKCLLRVVVEEVMAEFDHQAIYFPSFEMVIAYNPYSYRADNRHIMPNMVDRIFGMLDKALKVSG